MSENYEETNVSENLALNNALNFLIDISKPGVVLALILLFVALADHHCPHCPKRKGEGNKVVSVELVPAKADSWEDTHLLAA